MVNTNSYDEMLARLRFLDKERTLLENAVGLLSWDQETYLPSSGVEDRAEQLALLEGLAHEKLANAEVGELLDRLGTPEVKDQGLGGRLAAGEFPVGHFLRELRRDYDKAVKLPADFIREMAKAQGLSQAAWVAARKNNDFAAFAPHLEKMLDFARKKAAYLGWGQNGTSLYDGLLDLYEPGFNAQAITAVFTPLRESLTALIKKITALTPPAQAQGSGFLQQHYDVKKQDAFYREILSGIGFDLSRGRMDVSAHPFCTTLGFNDVRLTTRYMEDQPLSGLYSVIHESGHGFYELGIAPALRLSCLAGGTSMGIHESQSRLWENVIGRSRAFLQPWFPRFAKQFSENLGGVEFEDFYRAVNTVSPDFIRVEADEVCYSLHIILRFELEQRLFAGTLTISDLPNAWNKAVEEYLGLICPNDAQGVLQDVHWSFGAFGYFPSYALGNLYGLQLWEKVKADIPAIEANLQQMKYTEIHAWLKEHIHQKGRCAVPSSLIKELTGSELSEQYFLRYIEQKYTELYKL